MVASRHGALANLLKLVIREPAAYRVSPAKCSALAG
jgi:hypothetical protein